jgi:penicillin-binding protein 1A
VPLSVQISRTRFCEPSTLFAGRLQELRTAVQLERHFSQQELFAIYVNRAYFGDGLTGVQTASRSLFLKEPNQVTIAEAALIAGLVQSPSRYSPLKHPDRALDRRNAVIDAMVREGTISASQAESAKAAPLGIASPHVSTMPP